MTTIDFDPERDGDREPWQAVGDLVELLVPAEWTLVGGLMVQLHAIEHGVSELRAATDVDVLGQARPPRALSRCSSRGRIRSRRSRRGVVGSRSRR